MLKFNWVGVALVLSAGFLGGCGPSIRDLCERTVECDSSNGTVDECVEAVEQAQDIAETAGCSSELDDSLDCVDDNGECTNGRFTTDECASEQNALQECVQGNQDDGNSNG